MRGSAIQRAMIKQRFPGVPAGGNPDHYRQVLQACSGGRLLHEQHDVTSVGVTSALDRSISSVRADPVEACSWSECAVADARRVRLLSVNTKLPAASLPRFNSIKSLSVN